MAPWLRVFVVLAEDPSLVPSIHVSSSNPSVFHLASAGTIYVHGTLTYIQVKCIYP